MNERIEQALAALLERALEAASATGQFLESELPLVATEVLRWAALSGIGLGLIMATPAVVCAVTALRAFRQDPGTAIRKLRFPTHAEAEDAAAGFNTMFWAVRAEYDLGPPRSEREYFLRSEAREPWMVLGICSVLSAVLLLPAVPNIMDGLKAVIAPRLYLLEYAADVAGRAT